MNRPAVLFVCTHNSSRSQMAEGLLKHHYGHTYEALSAGTEPAVVSPFAIRAMQEMGIDISGHTSKSVDVFADRVLEYAVTVCDSAREICPYVPAKVNLHRRFEDPRAVQGTDEQKMAAFRRVRDEIGRWIDEEFRPDA